MYVITLDPDSPEYLEHFGVLGMHWGVRNSETQRKYDGGQKHSEARTDIAEPTTGNAYKGAFKPTLSEKQTKMLKRAAAGVAIGAGIAAGITIGAKTGVLKSVAKNGARKLADTAQFQKRGREFAQRVRTNAVNSVKTQSGRNEIKRKTKAAATDISKAVNRKTYGARAAAKRMDLTGKARLQAKQAGSKVWNSKRMAPIRKANRTFDYYTNDPRGRRKAANRITIGATGVALASAPFIEGYSMDSRELRRKNGRHASAKWMRNKERLS